MTEPVPHPALKAHLRRAALARRADLTPGQAADAAARAAAVAEAWIAGRSPATVALYAAIRGEIDAMPLAERLHRRGIALALPAVVEQGRPLAFRAWRPGEALLPGFAGIPEPSTEAAPALPDVVVAPLAAFDRTGHRIGYGAGFYDRTLEALSANRRIAALGLAFACQEVDAVPAEPHDRTLDAVATEAGLVRPGE